MKSLGTFSITWPLLSTKFALNDRVQVSSGPVNVRQTPYAFGTLLGTQATGARGTVIAGPSYGNGSWWWNLDYDVIPDGWSLETSLEKVIKPVASDYALSSGNTSVIQGRSVTNAMTATFTGTPDSPAFSVSGIPQYSQSSVLSVTCTSTQCTAPLVISTASLTPVGTYPITVTATSVGFTHTTSFNLTVMPLPLPPPMTCGTGETYVSIPVASSADDAEAGAISYVSYADASTCNYFTSTHGTVEIERSHDPLSPWWDAYTGFLRFNTNTIPIGKTITKARLGLALQLVLPQADNFDLLVHYYPTAPAGAFSCNDWTKNPSGPFAASFPQFDLDDGKPFRWENLDLTNVSNIIPGQKTTFRFWSGDGTVEPTGQNFPEFPNYDLLGNNGTVPYLEVCYQ